MSIENHEEVPNLPTKTIFTVIGAHLDGSSINDVIGVPQFNYYGVNTVRPDFDEYILITIGKN